MYEIIQSKKFRKSYKKILKSGKFRQDKFEEIVSFLRDNIKLPLEYHDHVLRGNLLGQRECHMAGDILLIYEIDLDEKIVTLADIGNHANLFNSD